MCKDFDKLGMQACTRVQELKTCGHRQASNYSYMHTYFTSILVDVIYHQFVSSVILLLFLFVLS